MSRRQYIGARYVPKFFDWDGSTEWRSGVTYEALTIVTRNGYNYTSKIPVPSNIGAPENNPEYWVVSGMSSEQIESIRQDLTSAQGDITELKEDLSESAGDLKSALSNYNSYDFLASASKTSETKGGLKYTWVDDGTCHVNGTVSGNSFNNIVVSIPNTLDWIYAGRKFWVEFSSTGNNIIGFIQFKTSGDSINEYFSDNRYVTVPTNMTGIVIRINPKQSATNVDETITFKVFSAKSNEKIADDINTLPDGSISKLFSVGNSILTGSVWTSGSFNHLVDYENAPYARIANALNITEKNVTHILLSNTGLVYDAGNGNFYDTISAADLSNYDYVLTHLWYEDLAIATSGLGNEFSVSGDGTLAGAIIQLAKYVESNNCRLILVGVPPVYPNSDNWGNAVFSTPLSDGYSISDADHVIHKIAKKYHFCFVDYEALDISYNYKSFTDRNNVHANNDNTYRVMGEYLGRCVTAQFEKGNIFNNIDTIVGDTWNLLTAEIETPSKNGISISASNGKIFLNGTSTAISIFYIGSLSLNAGTYRLSATNVESLPSGVALQAYNVDASALIAGGTSVYFSLESKTNVRIRIYIPNATTLTNNMIAPQLEAGMLKTDFALPKMPVDSIARRKINSISDTISDANSLDLLNINYAPSVRNGITYTWADSKFLDVRGTSGSGGSYYDLFNNSSALPNGISAGDVVYVNFRSSDSNIHLNIIIYLSGGNNITFTLTESKEIYIPSNAIGLVVRVDIYSNKAIIGTAHVLCRLYNTMPQCLLSDSANGHVPKSLLVSFIDDDTSSDDYVTKYRQACGHNGIVGNYAVMTKNIELGYTSLSKLLEYEEQGFCMLGHCYFQDTYWQSGSNRNIAQCRTDLVKCFRYMRDNGFLNYKYWVTPGGHHESDIIYLARYVGADCLISTTNGEHNRITDHDRYFIKRCSLGNNDTSVTTLKAQIDKFVREGAGWLIITTHFNSGWSNWDNTDDGAGYPVGYSRFNEIAQYVLESGCTVVPFSQGFSYFRNNLTN